MKKNNSKREQQEEEEHYLEILKAVAQAWHAHSGSSRLTNEYDAYRQNFHTKPSRFKLEATNKSLKINRAASRNWDFNQSLLDSYEIVSMSKKLERALVLDDPISGLNDQSRVHKRRRESKNSLRNLFNRMSSRRFTQAGIPGEDI